MGVETVALSGDGPHTDALNARAEPILREVGAAGGQRGRRRRVGRDDDERDLDRVAARGDPGGAPWRLSTIMGMPVRVDGRDRRRARSSRGCGGWTRRSAPTGRTARSLGSTAASSTDAAIRSCARCWRAASSCAMETGGYFDVRAGGWLDPSGYVKGWAVQRAAALRARPLPDRRGRRRRRCAARGGSASGTRTSATGWPRRSRCRDCGVATSGAYERGPHVIDPRTRPAGDRPVVGDRGRARSGDGGRLRHGGVRGRRPGAGRRRLAAMTIAGERVFTTRGVASKRNSPGSTVQPPSQCASARGAIVTSTATSSPGSASTIAKPASQRGGRSTALSGREA